MKYFMILSILLLNLNFCSTKTNNSEFDFANIMAKNNLWKEAVLRWEKLLPKMKNSEKIHNNLAIAYERLGELKKAEIEYKKALKIAPNNSLIKANYNRFKKVGRNKNEKK